MVFQQVVYVLEIDYGCTTYTELFSNFKKAYERIEELERNNIIVDCGNKYNTVYFEAIRRNDYGYFHTMKYKITWNLLTIYPEDTTVSYEMIKEKKENSNSKYTLKAEII